MSAFYTVQPITDFAIFTTPRQSRKGIQFKAAWSDTVNELESALAHLGARDIVMEIGVDAKHIRTDGQLRANAQPTHPGVRISFQSRKHGALSYTCDTYERAYGWQMPSWQANVRAIVKTLQALRAVDRYGATKGEQYAGFKALGAGTGAVALGGLTPEQAYATLVEHARIDCGPGEGARLFKLARANTHPDRNGGDQAAWDQVEQAAKALGLTS